MCGFLLVLFSLFSSPMISEKVIAEKLTSRLDQEQATRRSYFAEEIRNENETSRYRVSFSALHCFSEKSLGVVNVCGES